MRAGQTVVIYGAGGVGSNAVQGARFAGAKNVVVVDPVPFKREMAKVFGATHTFAGAEEGSVMTLSGIGHPANSTLNLGQAKRSQIRAFGMDEVIARDDDGTKLVGTTAVGARHWGC